MYAGIRDKYYARIFLKLLSYISDIPEAEYMLSVKRSTSKYLTFHRGTVAKKDVSSSANLASRNVQDLYTWSHHFEEVIYQPQISSNNFVYVVLPSYVIWISQLSFERNWKSAPLTSVCPVTINWSFQHLILCPATIAYFGWKTLGESLLLPVARTIRLERVVDKGKFYCRKDGRYDSVMAESGDVHKCSNDHYMPAWICKALPFLW